MTLVSLVLLLAGFVDAGPSRVLVGTGTPGDSGEGGPATRAAIREPFDVAFAGDGDLVFSDTGNHKIKRVDRASGAIRTIAGTGAKGFSGDGGPATRAKLDEPYGLAIGPEGDVYFADRLNRRVRRIEAATGLISTVAGDGSKSSSGDGGPASRAGLNEPNGVALDGRGRLYIADVSDHRVRVVDLKSGVISTFAGTGKPKRDGDGGPATSASIFGPRAVEVGPDGRVWILERGGHSLRVVDPKTGLIATVAGTGKPGYSGDGGRAKLATFNGPKELHLDRAGNVYVVDTENHAIRRIDAKTGIITTAAGGSSGPKLNRPHGVAIGPDGAIVIGDTNNHVVPATNPP